MIELLFEFGPEVVLVKIEGKKVTFGNTSYGAQMSEIDGLRLDRAGVIREFPDLEGKKYWREIAIKRFKEKISKMKSETEIAQYVINDLKNHGYTPKQMQVGGHRPVKIE